MELEIKLGDSIRFLKKLLPKELKYLSCFIERLKKLFIIKAIMLL